MNKIDTPKLSNHTIYNAAILAPFACHAYSVTEDNILGRTEFSKAIKSSGWDSFRIFDKDSAHGVIVSNSTDCVIAIAGTDDIKDALDDSKVLGKNIAATCGVTYRVPSGFNSYADLALEAIEDAIDEADKAKRVWVVGHSLGGAAAHLVPLKREWLNPELVVTVGAPCSIKRGQAWKYNYRTVNIANHYDLVATGLKWVYSRPGIDLFVSNKGKLTLSRPAWSWAKSVFTYATSFFKDRAGFLKEAVKNHGCGTYTTLFTPETVKEQLK